MEQVQNRSGAGLDTFDTYQDRSRAEFVTLNRYQDRSRAGVMPVQGSVTWIGYQVCCRGRIGYVTGTLRGRLVAIKSKSGRNPKAFC